MIKNISRITVIIVFVFSSFIAKAQLGFNYSQYDLGFGGSLNSVYGDAETIKMEPAVHLNFTFNQTPYLNYVFEAQIGQMAGGDSLNTKSGRQFTSSFSSYQLRLQLQGGELIDYSKSAFSNVMKNFYVSAGLGMIYDHITGISRNSYQLPGFYTGGEDKASQLFLPLRIGYEFKIYNSYSQPNVKVDIGYEYNIVFGDQLDGFKTGLSNDKFSQFFIGVRFAIGGVTSYSKEINR